MPREQLEQIARLLHRAIEGPDAVGVLEVATHMRNCMAIVDIVPKPTTSIEKLETVERLQWLRAAQAFLSSHRVTAK